MRIRSLLPVRADYSLMRDSWRGDVLAGLTVGIVALPLALAFGISSGVGAAAGLVTAVVAGIIAAIFGGSHVQVSGPTGAMTVVLAPIVAIHGPGSIAFVCLLAGAIMMVAGALQLGRIINFIPWPVIEGFTAGIAVIIFLQQVPAALDVTAAVGKSPAYAAWAALQDTDWASAGWSLAAVAAVALLMIGFRWIHHSIPGSLIAVVVVAFAAELLDAPLARIGALPDSLPAPIIPHIGFATAGTLIPAALAVAALASIESLLSAKVASTMSDTGDPKPDRELFGQGLASIVSGMFGGMPATGAIARTAVNVNAGGRSRLASVIHAILLLAVVYLLSTTVSRIPLAALSGVLMVVAIRMIDLGAAKALVMSTKSGTAVFAVTLGVTVMFDLVEAVEIGLVVAAVFALHAISLTSGAHRDPLPGPAHIDDERIALFRLNGLVFFAAADRVLEDVHAIDDIDVVIISMAGVTMLDSTAARKLGELITTLERRGVTVLVKGIRESHQRMADKVGVVDSLRHHKHLFTHLAPAVEHARSHVNRAAGRTHLPPQFSRPATMPPAVR